jgi:IS605 OrfB family transposase
MITKTIACKIKASEEEGDKLYRTLEAFRDACNYISKTAFNKRVFNPVALHHITYRDVRERFNLPANIAIRARDRVAKAYKQKRNKLLRFDKLSMELDARLFRVIRKPDGIYASISTVQKRVKPPLARGKRQEAMLEGTNPTHAVVVYKRKNFYLHITVEVETPTPEGSDPVGVDIGMNNLLVASNGFTAEGKSVIRKRQHFRDLRSSLQAKGTKSSKRRLKQLGDRERSWVNTVLHQISRQFVDSLNEGDVVVLENLNGIRNNTKHRKKQRADFHSWAFKRLQFLVEYKALEKGIPVIYADAKNTSKTCPRCGHISDTNRKTQSLFRCVSCGFQHNADWVASVNLSMRAGSPALGSVVNEPNVGLNAFSMHDDSPTSSVL